MTEDQLEALKEYIDASINYAIAAADSADSPYLLGACQCETETRLHEAFFPDKKEQL